MKDRKLYISFMILAAGTSLLKSLLFAKILSIPEFGAYSLIILISTYVLYVTNLGLEPSFLRQGSKLFGTAHGSRLKYLNAHIYSLSLLVFGAVGALSFLVFLLCKQLGLETFEEAFYLAGILGSANFLFGITTTYLRITHNFLFFSAFLAGRNILALILGYFWGLHSGTSGAVLSEILSYVAMALIIAYWFKFPIVFPNKKLLSPLVKAGYPFSFTYLFRTLAQNTDRWIIMYALGATAVGLYSFSMIVFTAGLGVLNIITQPFVSKWLADFGKNDNVDKLNQDIIDLIKLCYKYLLPVFIVFVIASPWLIDTFFPKYSEAKTVLIIISFATLIQMTNIFDTSLIAQKKGKAFAMISLKSFIICGCLYVLGYFIKATLAYYAVIFAIGQLTQLLLTYIEAKNFTILKSLGIKS